jgi:GTP-binding protein HflX
LLRLEHLYRRRIPVDKVITAELARTCTELSQEIRCQIGLVITRRGLIEQVIVGNGRELSLTDLSKVRTGAQSLRGVRLVHTHLHNEPLTHDDLTDLALLRLDLIAAIGVGPQGLPADLYLAHVLPPNPKGQAYEVWQPSPFHSFQLPCNAFVEDLEKELTKNTSIHVVKESHESALLISVSTKSRVHQEERLEELAELSRSNGVTVLETIVQRVHEVHPKYLMGSGKLKEVVIKALQQGADLLIVEQDLTPAQVRAMAEVTEMKVIDRTQLILDIFARRAHSREGKIQVELAQLRYLLPRLSGRSTALSRLGGGIGGRGPGETKLETDRRRVRDRINHLERELIAVARHRDQRRARRSRHHIPIVSIVGYTNAGKSTLLNALTESDVPVQDRPFETLDTSSRRLRILHGYTGKGRVPARSGWAGEPAQGRISARPGGAGEMDHVDLAEPSLRGNGMRAGRESETDVIITDTVGFIRDLPRDLMGAFRTTLEELRDADLLLHLADASSRDLDGQIHAVEAILSELELMRIPRVLVLNKIDRLHPQDAEVLIRRYRTIAISAVSPQTLPPLVELLARRLADVRRACMSSVECSIPSGS